jgi:hypothetical protein
MPGSIPQTPEEFQFWLVEKVGEIQTSQASMNGKLDTAIAKHEALEGRVDEIVDDARSARNWENGKLLGMGLLQTAIIWLKHTAGMHGA